MPLTPAAKRQICSRSVAMMAAVIVSGYCARADAAVIALDAVARGWYTDEGVANATPPNEGEPRNELRNYIVGDVASTDQVPRQVSRNFFVFDLSGIGGQINGASLNLFNPANGFSSRDGFVTYRVFDVSTAVSTLVSHEFGPPGVEIYGDLGTGTQYGEHLASAADDATTIAISLNATALAALNQSTGLFAFGGAIATLDQVESSEYVFGFTGIDQGPGTTQLVLVVDAIPEPNSAYLFGSTLFFLGATTLIWRKRNSCRLRPRQLVTRPLTRL
jgi:hypothetical protein